MKGFGKKQQSKKKESHENTKSSKEQIIAEAFKFHSQGNIAKAVRHYQYFINQGFQDHRVFTNYGAILKDLGKLKEAEFLTRKAIEFKPDFANAHSNLGSILIDLGKLKEAEISTRHAIELKPDYADAYINLGTILNDLGELKGAEISTRKAIRLKPDLANPNYLLSLILSKSNKYKDALIELNKAISKDPKNHIYQGELARLGFLIGESVENQISS